MNKSRKQVRSGVYILYVGTKYLLVVSVELVHVTLVGPCILTLLPDFWKICASLFQGELC